MIYALLALILALSLVVVLAPLRHNRRAVAIISVLFFIGGFGVYAVVGAPRLLPLLAQREEKLAAIRQDILTYSKAVKENPKDLRAWVMLGHSFIETGQWHAAANAFKQAVILSGGDPALILAYAKAMILDEDGQVSDAAKKSLTMVLLQQPKNPEARYFLAVRALQEGKTEDAMNAMRELYRSLPDDSPLKEKIDRQIGRR